MKPKAKLPESNIASFPPATCGCIYHSPGHIAYCKLHAQARTLLWALDMAIKTLSHAAGTDPNVTLLKLIELRDNIIK